MTEMEAHVQDMPKTWVYWTVFYRSAGCTTWAVSGPYTTDTEAITMAMSITADEKRLVSTELPL